jgi:hypothetical protein
VFRARSFTGLGMLPAIITARGTTLPDIIGVLTGIDTTDALTGGTEIGGMAAGIGIEMALSQSCRKINQIAGNNIPGLIGPQIGGLPRSVFRGTRDKRRPQT